jgi:sugar/nucleoside kinase (ribokinase family)
LNFRLWERNFDMQSLANRRLDRAARKAAEAGLNLSPEAALEAAELAHKNGNPFALVGIGKVDLLAHLVKG